MSRDAGFAIADIDAGILDDPKFRNLARRHRDEALLARLFTGYIAVLTASWGHGRRMTLNDAAPIWLTDLDELRLLLVAEDLLDASGMVPERVWDGWFNPAKTRRDANRDRWARSARARRGKGGETSSASSPRGHDADPARSHAPSVPPSPSVPPGPTGPSSTRPRGGRLESLGSILPRVAPEPGGIRS